MDALKAKKGFICDMDGVIYHGDRLLPDVKEFVEWLYKENKSFLFLTNSSERSPRELQQKLERMGLYVDESHFYTSALATAKFISSQKPGCSAYVIGAPGLVNALYDQGITMNSIDPDYVIVGETSSYNYETVVHASNLVRNGAKLIGTNTDLTGRGRHRSRVPRAHISDRDGDGQEGVFRRQAQSAHDAHGTQDARRPFGGGCDDRRQNGHGCHCGHRNRS